MRKMHGKIRVLIFALLIFALPAPPASASAEDFRLAGPAVEILSKGTFYLKYKTHQLNFTPVTVFNAHGGMSVTYMEPQPHVRHVARGGSLYVIDDKEKIMQIHPVKISSAFAPGAYRFAGSGEETKDGKTFQYEDAEYFDGSAVLRLTFGGGKLESIVRTVQPGGGVTHRFPFITEFGPGVLDLHANALVRSVPDGGDRLFEIPEGYEVRKTIQQLKEEAKQGKTPDDPMDKLALQMSLSEDERLERERDAGKQPGH